MGKLIGFLFLIVVLVSQAACGGDNPAGTRDAENFEGILEMDLLCRIIGGDTTDFQPRPEGQPPNYSLVGACPNPTNGTTTIMFQLPQQDSVWILVYDRPSGGPIDTLFNSAAAPGSWSIIWTNNGPDGIYRVVMRTASGFQSYGDVQFDEMWTPSN